LCQREGIGVEVPELAVVVMPEHGLGNLLSQIHLSSNKSRYVRPAFLGKLSRAVE